MGPIRSLIALAALALAVPVAARADDPEARGEWLKTLIQPGTAATCCDVSDCQRTVADWYNGQWWAIVVGQWTPIPPNTILTNRSIDGEAYVCASHYRKIYCFVKPDFGM